MGATQSKGGVASGQPAHTDHHLGRTARGQAITGGTGKKIGQRARPTHARPVDELDFDFVINALGKLLLFTKTDPSLVRKVICGMWEQDCDAGVLFNRANIWPECLPVQHLLCTWHTFTPTPVRPQSLVHREAYRSVP
jgi:hypothetical protein